MSKCNSCYHKKICIDSANYKAAESCKHHVPAADVQEVKHGHFRRLTFSGDTIICSECKMAYNIFETNGAENFNFCPHCGARMDGDADADGNDNKTPET